MSDLKNTILAEAKKIAEEVFHPLRAVVEKVEADVKAEVSDLKNRIAELEAKLSGGQQQ